MKPIKLTMTGFESYKDKTTIDFEKLGEKGLYLITGDTGAGKTTIFDAITFALYGSPSGENREGNMLRSHFATVDIPTEVELEFETKGKKYRVKRNPDYERKALRGTGTTVEKANACLEYLSENQEPVTNLNKVTAEIENILNLKRDQFCRIAMIAQGNFQKLLLSGKDEKEKLFREIFHTEKYQQLQKKLKEDSTAALGNVASLKQNLQNALGRIEVNEQDEKASEINRIKSTASLIEGDLELLRTFVSKDDGTLQKLSDEMEEIQKQLDAINLDIQTGERRVSLKNQIDQIEKNLLLKNKELTELKEALLRAEKEAEKVPELEKEKTLLEASLNAYEEISLEDKRLNEFETQIKTDEKKLNQLGVEKEKFSSQVEALKNEADTLKNAGEKSEALKASLEKKLEAHSDFEEIRKEVLELSIARDKLSFTQNKVLEADADYKDANASYAEKVSLFNLEQAGILAEGLKEGSPCPVCGSTEHPHPAVKSAKAPSQEEIKTAKEKVDELQKIFNELTAQTASKKTFVEETEKKLNRLLEKYFENLSASSANLSSELSKRNGELENEVKEIRMNLQKEEKSKARREEIDRELPSVEKKLSDIISDSANLQSKISGDKGVLETERKKLAEKKSGLKYETLVEAKGNLTRLEKEINNLNAQVEMEKQKLSECEKKITELNSSSATLKQQLKETKPVDLDKLHSDQNEALLRKKALNDQRDSLTRRKAVNSESVSEIEKLTPEIAKATERYNMIKDLYDVAMGSNRGISGKPSLEVYVQMNCLDKINHRANLRLKKMTENQYELRRHVEENGAELGLDLDVKDFYTGRERSVKTLSGGEQFQASLSLALGLADEVQESSGGIKLDAMFIDEGFGTLDPDTLNKAMRALEDLAQGNKLIGIISHVEELKTRIPKQIVVKKDEAGVSHAGVVEA